MNNTYKENKWETFASKDAQSYIDTSLLEVPKEKRKEKFFESGRYFTDKTFAKVENLLPDIERALEIGAGAGRLALPHARLFQEVIAVDIAPTMLKELNENAKNANLKNIQTFLPEQPWDEKTVSYAYSYFVFQHITDFTIIKHYIQRIADCLKEQGVAQLHFDTRKKSLLYNIRNKIPDFLLPRTQRKGIRRIRRNANHIYRLFDMNKLEIIEMHGHNSANTFFVLRKY